MRHLKIMLFALMVPIIAFGQAVDEGTAARDIIKKWQDAVVAVKIVIKFQMATGGREMVKNENATEAIATIIDSSGLAVLSLSNTDPTRLFGGLSFGGEDMPRHSWGSNVSDIKLVMADGQEIPARIVLRDKDLDLAFIRPRDKQSRPFSAVDLNSDVKPDIMDRILVLSRLGRVADRAPFISLGWIQAIVDKPRTFYVSGMTSIENGLGAPVFSLDGKVVGIMVLRILKSKGVRMGGMLGGVGSMGILPIILPAEDVLKVARQAMEIK